jgi:hypothetical protein
MWHNLLPSTIEQAKIYNMLEISKNSERNLKLKSLGSNHKASAHASCKCIVEIVMSNMKEFSNNTTTICLVN